MKRKKSEMSFEVLEQRKALAVTYHGGALLPHVEAQAIYLGKSNPGTANWTYDPSLAAEKKQLDKFISYIVQSPFVKTLDNAGYSAPAGASFSGTAVPGVTANILTSNTVDDSQIRTIIQTQISSGAAKSPTASNLYVVYAPPGVSVTVGSMTSNASFLGYHLAFAGKTFAGTDADIHYAVIPYPGSPNPEHSNIGYDSNFNAITVVSSHEIAEALTNPNICYKDFGWYDDNFNSEIGDLGQGTTHIGGYQIQRVVDQNDNNIAPQASGPVIDSLTLSKDSVTAGSWGTVTISATVSDPSARVSYVRFFTSSGAFVGNGRFNGTAWSLNLPVASMHVGSNSYYAVATDSSGVSTPACSETVSVSLLVVPRPPINDNFESATVIRERGSQFVVRGSNASATKQYGEPVLGDNPSGKSVWWSWRAPKNGRVSINTAGSDFECMLAVCTGSTLSSLKVVASATSLATFNAVAGQTYYFLVDGRYGNSGNISLSLKM